MDSWQRLEAVIKWAGMSANKFALEIGLKRSETLYQIKKGNNSISVKLATKIIDRYPQIDYAWLMTSCGDMFGDKSRDGARQIDLLKGDPSDPVFYKQSPSQITISIVAGCEFAVELSSSVLVEIIPAGSTVFLRKIDKGFIDYGVCYMVVIEGKTIVARVRKESVEAVRLELGSGDLSTTMIIDRREIVEMFAVLGYIALM